MRSWGITSEEKVLKVRDKRAWLVTLRARTSREMHEQCGGFIRFISCYFICRKRSSPEFQASAVWSHGKRFWNRCRSQRVYELDELLQWIWNVSDCLQIWSASRSSHKCLRNMWALLFSCFRFADEVNGEIPEVDYRGRIKRLVFFSSCWTCRSYKRKIKINLISVYANVALLSFIETLQAWKMYNYMQLFHLIGS